MNETKINFSVPDKHIRVKVRDNVYDDKMRTVMVSHHELYKALIEQDILLFDITPSALLAFRLLYEQKGGTLPATLDEVERIFGADVLPSNPA